VELVAIRDETPTARTLVFRAPDFPAFLPGQHVDVRLTAEDGYRAERSYSIASAPEDEYIELTIERLDDGEVSPYLTDGLQVSDNWSCAGRSAATSPGRSRPAARCCWWPAARASSR